MIACQARTTSIRHMIPTPADLQPWPQNFLNNTSQIKRSQFPYSNRNSSGCWILVQSSPTEFNILLPPWGVTITCRCTVNIKQTRSLPACMSCKKSKPKSLCHFRHVCNQPWTTCRKALHSRFCANVQELSAEKYSVWMSVLGGPVLQETNTS